MTAHSSRVSRLRAVVCTQPVEAQKSTFFNSAAYTKSVLVARYERTIGMQQSSSHHPYDAADAPDMLIKAMKAPDSDQVFFVGPFARRITFHTQQNRALNLVWALAKKKIVSPPIRGTRVAVVGASVAGCAAAAALAEAGCEVQLFDAQDISSNPPANPKLSTSNRFVHPSINFWPMQPSGLTDTTSLFAFDWFAAPAKEILDRHLSLERETYEGWAIEQKFLKRITRYMVNDNQVWLRGLDLEAQENPASQYGPFDIAIFCTGFGPDGSGPYDDYWTVGRYYALTQTNQLAVAGTGDGALIEILSILAGHNVDVVKVAVSIASELNACTELLTIIRDAENLAAMDEPVASSSSTPSLLQQAYSAASMLVPPTVSALFRMKRAPSIPNVLWIGRGDTPFSVKSAPIYKLLLAMVLKDKVTGGRIIYRQGEFVDFTPIISSSGDEEFIVSWKPKDASLDSAMICNFRPIDRRGPQKVLQTLNSSAAWLTDIEERQTKYLDKLLDAYWKDDPGGIIFSKQSLSFEGYRNMHKQQKLKTLADWYMDAMISRDEEYRNIDLTFVGSPLRFIVVGLTEPAKKLIETLPRELFGVPLDFREPDGVEFRG